MLHPLPLSELCAPAVALIRAKARGPKVQGCPEAGGGPAHAPPAHARPPRPPAAAAPPAARARRRGAQRPRPQPPLPLLPPPAAPRAPSPCSAGRLCRACSQVRGLHVRQQERLSGLRAAVQSEPSSHLTLQCHPSRDCPAPQQCLRTCLEQRTALLHKLMLPPDRSTPRLHKQGGTSERSVLGGRARRAPVPLRSCLLHCLPLGHLASQRVGVDLHRSVHR